MAQIFIPTDVYYRNNLAKILGLISIYYWINASRRKNMARV